MHERSAIWCEGEVVADGLLERGLWLRERRKFVCASETAAVMRLSSPFPEKEGVPHTGAERYEDLRKRKRDGGEFEQNEYMYWGSLLEQPIIEGLAHAPGSLTYGWNIRPCGLLIRDAHCSRLAATPDMWVDDGTGPMVGELKYSGFPWRPSKAKPGWQDYVPRDYLLQVHAQMACTGAQRGCLVQVAGNKVAHAIPIPRDEALIERIREAAEMFWIELDAEAA